MSGSPLHRSSASEPTTSSSLLERVKARDGQAWQRFSDLYTRLVYHWARQSGLQAHDASDVAQEVLLAVAKNIGRFRHDRESDTFRGWLKTITRNKVRDQLRSARVRPKAVGGSEMRERLNEEPDPWLEDSNLNESPLVRAAMERVRGEFEERTWQLFWKVFVEERPAADVAAKAGISVWAVYKAKSRVLTRLREELADFEMHF